MAIALPAVGRPPWPRKVPSVSVRRARPTPRWLLALYLTSLLLTGTIATAPIAAAYHLVPVRHAAAVQHGPLPPAPTQRHAASSIPRLTTCRETSAGCGAFENFSPPRLWFRAPPQARAPPPHAPLITMHSAT
jgi:hypothetical protein